MAYRETCGGLVRRLRDLIGDSVSPDVTIRPVWSNDQLQTTLDARRQVVRYLSLTSAYTVEPGGAVVYLDYYAGCGDWETDAQLTDTAGNALTPETVDCETGYWAFASHQPLPVYLSGKTYDLYAAAADQLEKWAAKVKLEYTFSPGSGQYVRSQKFQMLQQLAASYRCQQRVETVQLIRSDTQC